MSPTSASYNVLSVPSNQGHLLEKARTLAARAGIMHLECDVEPPQARLTGEA